MEQTISFVTSEISKIRTGRANTGMFNNILVNYYDNDTPLNQIANIAALDAITISIQPFDKTIIKKSKEKLNLSRKCQIPPGTYLRTFVIT